MATPPSNEQFVGINASQNLTEKSSGLINDKRQIYTYADLMGGAVGATTLETGTAGLFAGVSKLGTTYEVGGVNYDSYNLKCWVTLTPEATSFVTTIGAIELSVGDMFVFRNRSNIESVDFSGFGGYTNNPLNLGAMVDDAANVARPIAGEFYINQDNTLPGLPSTYNGLYIVAGDAANFECDVYVDIDFYC